MDEETGYVTKLCAYLNRYGGGLWRVSAFTEKEMVFDHMTDGKIDILMATAPKLLEGISDRFSKGVYVWLSGEKGQRWRGKRQQKIYTIYRYQSARVIGDALRDIVEYMGLMTRTGKRNAVIYSPVGRCGKTGITMKYARESVSTSGKWLYVGMEDYGGHIEGKDSGEDFLYYMKERNEEKIISIIASCESIIPSPFSLFDTRLVDAEDVLWFLKVFENVVEYRGVLFDIGTGVMSDFEVLTVFEHVIVPYIQDKISLNKKEQFQELIEAYDLEELKEKLSYLDMSRDDVFYKLKEILG